MNLKLKISQRHAAAEALKIKSRQFITVCRAERITCLQQATVDRINARQRHREHRALQSFAGPEPAAEVNA